MQPPSPTRLHKCLAFIKKWGLLAIVASVAVALTSPLWTGWVNLHFFRSPSQEEKQAVFDLVSDIRTHPVSVRMFYLKPHPFIGSGWLKYQKTDAYFESMGVVKNLFEFADFGKTEGWSDLLMPVYGKKIVTIGEVDKLKVNGKTQYLVTAHEVNPSEPSELSMEEVAFYTESDSCITKDIIRHVNDPMLPGNIRESLKRLLTGTRESVSFKHAVARGRDFLVLSQRLPASAVGELPPKGPAPATSLDVASGQTSFPEFLECCLALRNALQKWADANRIAVDLSGTEYLTDEQIKNLMPLKQK